MAAFIVHDLKNPVAAVDLYAQVLLTEADEPERVRDGAKQIRGAARALMRLILDLLDVSKGEEGKLVPQVATVDLPKLAAEVIEAVAARARAMNVTLAVELSPPTVRADPDLLRRVLENLVDNSLRHSLTAGHVLLSAAVRDGEIRLSVADTGPGVPLEIRERIFDPFVQAESAARGTRSGRGLGLTFCRFAIEAHGGRIWVEDANPGARFVFALPNEG